MSTRVTVNKPVDPPAVTVTITLPVEDAVTLRDIIGCSSGEALYALYAELSCALDADYPESYGAWADFNAKS